MKSQLQAVAVVATFIFSNNAVFAACADEIPIQAARMTTQSSQEAEALEAAFKYLKEAKMLCAQGDEGRAVGILNQLKGLLASMGR